MGFFLCAYALQSSLISSPSSGDVPNEFQQLTSEFCIDCHSGADSEARLDLAALVSEPMARHFADWRRIIRVLDDGTMPPEDADQPSEQRSLRAKESARASLERVIRRAANDPGPAVVRRLTNAEYDYCIEDLTGLELNLSAQLVSDNVGGSGFTNSATAQFMQDATLERYIETAKRVADHAVIGAGPIFFASDPGQTGMELSAIKRLQRLYRQHGFRASAGEGAKAYGLERFPKAFHVAWSFRYRTELGQGDQSMEQLAGRHDLEPKFARHIYRVLTKTDAQFPLSEIIKVWNQFPAPSEIDGDVDSHIEQQSNHLFDQVMGWQARFAGSASTEEEAALLTWSDIDVPAATSFQARASRKLLVDDDNFTADINDPSLWSKDGRVRLKLIVEPASADIGTGAVVIFANPAVQFRYTDIVEPDPVPLKSILAPAEFDRIGFGTTPGGTAITDDEFVVSVGKSLTIEFELPRECRRAELLVDARLDPQLGRDAVVRCTIEDVNDGRQYSTLLRDRESASMDRWEAGLEEFGTALPQISHREPAPSDRDPIPSPYDNTYNTAERNYFHTAVKYFRDDEFLIQNLVDNSVAEQLEIAWTDLLCSFDYHDVNLRFVAGKFDIDIEGQSIDSIDQNWINDQPRHVRGYFSTYKSQYEAVEASLRSAQDQHLRDLIDLASRAWRRPISTDQSDELRRFYDVARKQHQLSHRQAVRATIARILVSPNFLHRVEKTNEGRGPTPLSDHELASRLSFSIWSSVPDQELLNAAMKQRLSDGAALSSQVDRMLRSAKSRRLATEFFGQWLGFYQFDRFRGVDVERFPEFDDRLKHSMYDQAIAFFEHIVREDRPYTEILHADYTFLDPRTAEHFDVPWNSDETNSPQRLTDVTASARGGLFGLGAVLTSTSAPLRTSPVKRGEWILRRLIGTPVPPPPADAGSISAEESLGDGKTVRDRLAVHRSRAECMNCHLRIDPLGFALENFDSLGRWRETYVDGQPIDASGVLASGESIEGIGGLRSYLREQEGAFRRTLARKLVAYFLGRSETAADVSLIETIDRRLEADPRFSVAVMAIVESPQFRQIRGSEYVE